MSVKFTGNIDSSLSGSNKGLGLFELLGFHGVYTGLFQGSCTARRELARGIAGPERNLWRISFIRTSTTRLL